MVKSFCTGRKRILTSERRLIRIIAASRNKQNNIVERDWCMKSKITVVMIAALVLLMGGGGAKTELPDDSIIFARGVENGLFLAKYILTVKVK